MKDKKVTFAEFVNKILGEDASKIIFEASIQSIIEEATSYIKETLPKKLITWNDLYNHLTKALKTNNGNIINQVKPYLVMEHNLFLFFPTTQFIFNKKLNPLIFG